MVDPKLGTKRVCEACGAKFYDLNKEPVICPKCGHSFDPMAAVATMPVAEIEPTAENTDNDDETLEDEDEDAVSLDTMVDEEADDDDDENLGDFEGDEALLDDNDEDDTLLDEADDDEESFLEDDEDDD